MFLDMEFQTKGCSQKDYSPVPDLEVCQTWICDAVKATVDDDDDDEPEPEPGMKTESLEMGLTLEQKTFLIVGLVALFAVCILGYLVYHYVRYIRISEPFENLFQG